MINFDNGDNEKFLQRLGENINKGSVFVYACAVMDNHTLSHTEEVRGRSIGRKRDTP